MPGHNGILLAGKQNSKAWGGAALECGGEGGAASALELQGQGLCSPEGRGGERGEARGGSSSGRTCWPGCGGIRRLALRGSLGGAGAGGSARPAPLRLLSCHWPRPRPTSRPALRPGGTSFAKARGPRPGQEMPTRPPQPAFACFPRQPLEASLSSRTLELAGGWKDGASLTRPFPRGGAFLEPPLHTPRKEGGSTSLKCWCLRPCSTPLSRLLNTLPRESSPQTASWCPRR